MRTHYKKAGFTLVELILAIAIIAVLATIILVAYSGASSRAKDSRRLNDMQTIVSALYVYKTQVGYFPASVNNTGLGWESSGTNPSQFISALKTASVASAVPVDPVNVPIASQPWLGKVYNYLRYPAGTYGCDATRGDYYVLGVRDMESSSNPHPNSPGWSCSLRNWQTEFDWVTGAFTD